MKMLYRLMINRLRVIIEPVKKNYEDLDCYKNY